MKPIVGLIALLLIMVFAVYSLAIGVLSVLFGDFIGVYPIMVGLWLISKLWEASR